MGLTPDLARKARSHAGRLTPHLKSRKEGMMHTSIDVHLDARDEFRVSIWRPHDGQRAIEIKSNVCVYLGPDEAARLIAAIQEAFPDLAPKVDEPIKASMFALASGQELDRYGEIYDVRRDIVGPCFESDSSYRARIFKTVTHERT